MQRIFEQKKKFEIFMAVWFTANDFCFICVCMLMLFIGLLLSDDQNENNFVNRSNFYMTKILWTWNCPSFPMMMMMIMCELWMNEWMCMNCVSEWVYVWAIFRVVSSYFCCLRFFLFSSFINKNDKKISCHLNFYLILFLVRRTRFFPFLLHFFCVCVFGCLFIGLVYSFFFNYFFPFYEFSWIKTIH